MRTTSNDAQTNKTNGGIIRATSIVVQVMNTSHPKHESRTVLFSARGLGLLLLAGAVILIIAHIASQAAHLKFPDVAVLASIYKNLDLNEEGNPPAFFSSACMLLSAALCFVIAAYYRKRNLRQCLYWSGISAVLLFLSFDEITAFHDRMWWLVHKALDTSGPLLYGWVVPYGITVVLLALIYIRFIICLAPRTRALFIASALLFVSGALGFEMIAGAYESMTGVRYQFADGTAEESPETFGLLLFVTAEESLEMFGLVLFVYALLDFIARERIVIAFETAVASQQAFQATKARQRPIGEVPIGGPK